MATVVHAQDPLFSGGLTAVDIEAPASMTDASSATCGGCHRRVYRQWVASGHADAWNGAAFQATWTDHPKGWCLMCHLPSATAQSELTGTASPVQPHHELNKAAEKAFVSEGVGCASCHVRDGEVLTPYKPGWFAKNAHSIRQDTRLAEPEFCAGCHEFAFPVHEPLFPFAYGDTPMQSTWSEWSSSSHADEGDRCQDCHMPRGQHKWPGGHDLAWLADHVDVEVASDGATATVRLSAIGAGHAVPTGDVFRKLEVELCADRACDDPMGKARFFKFFRPTDTSWRIESDTRVPPPTINNPEPFVKVEAPLTGAATWWRLWIVYGESRLAERLPQSDVRGLVAEGAVGSE